MLKSICSLINDNCSLIKDQVERAMTKSIVIKRNIGKKSTLSLDVSDKEFEKLKLPCLYRWWASTEAIQLIQENINKERLSDFQQLIEKCDKDNEGNFLLYFGKSINGRKRIINQHLNGSIKTSTIRHTLYSLCKDGNLIKSEFDVNKLFENSYFEWLAFENNDKEYIIVIEAICIALGFYPLNVEGNPSIGEWKNYLMKVRKNY